jgi:hypothetical protein
MRAHNKRSAQVSTGRCTVTCVLLLLTRALLYRLIPSHAVMARTTRACMSARSAMRHAQQTALVYVEPDMLQASVLTVPTSILCACGCASSTVTPGRSRFLLAPCLRGRVARPCGCRAVSLRLWSDVRLQNTSARVWSCCSRRTERRACSRCGMKGSAPLLDFYVETLLDAQWCSQVASDSKYRRYSTMQGSSWPQPRRKHRRLSSKCATRNHAQLKAQAQAASLTVPAQASSAQLVSCMH